jgi:RimJ/RimL family protein N-acetyltransferase/N-acetylglutamate synthase-like GNAT family acetyltransferase
MIRPLRDDDIPAVARLWRELRPDAVHSERGLRHVVESFPARAEAEFWLADEGGVVAWAFAHRRFWRADNNGYVWVGVLPDARGRGVGAELWELAEGHVSALGVARINADVVGDAAGERFLARRGFVQTRTIVLSAVDPRSIDAAELSARLSLAEADGYRLVPYADADLDALYRLDLEASDDAPGDDAPHELSLEEWRRELLDFPDLTHQGSFVVAAGSKPVAYSALSIDRDGRRGRNEGTGTARAHRGRGLASLAKLAQLRWAAEHGIERVIADNDEQNAPMLAINRRLGYRPFTERRAFVRELTGRAETASGPKPAAPAP